MPKTPRRPQSTEELVLRHVAGRSKIVLVEGPTDASILTRLFQSFGSAIVFEPHGSEKGLQGKADEVAEQLRRAVYSIRDRDFRSDEEVLPCYQEGYTGSHFTWQHYTLENYLLEPQAIVGVCEVLKRLLGSDVPPAFASLDAAMQAIERLARALAPQAAGNWLLRELTDLQVISGLPKYSESPEGLSVDHALRRIIQNPIVQLAAQTHPAFEEETLHANFDSKLAAINASFPDDFHRFISGKYIRDALYRQIPAVKLPKSSFTDLLIGYTNPVPDDLTTIVKRQILKM